MSQISAAGNLSIEMQSSRWRLLINGNAEETILMEAMPGQPLRYLPRFGSRRRLPDSGALPVAYIQRVVLGWSNEDESWHLGLVLEPSLAQARGSRWCEIAHWPDPETNVFADIATQAGQGLARTITRPFSLIPPRSEAQSAMALPLPELPLKFDLWTLERVDANNLRFTRVANWAQSRVVRVLWYSFWLVVYIVLAVTTLVGHLALPSPEFLPYLGLAAAVILVGMIAYLLYQLLTIPNRIEIDAGAGSVMAMRGRRVRWHVNRSQIQAVYVTLVVNKKGKKQKLQFGELNLLMKEGRFRPIIEDSNLNPRRGDEAQSANPLMDDLLIPLKSDDVYTDLQAAGLYMAQALDVTCMYDRRMA